MRYVIALALVAALSSVASATMTISLVEVDKGGILPTRITTDIMVTTDTDWLGAQLVLLPSASTKIYQDPFGSANPQSPDPALAYGYWDEESGTIPPVNSTLRYDTYVSNGVCGETVSLLAPVDLGYFTQVFDKNNIQQGWYTSDIDDTGTLRLARITLTNNTMGTWSLLVTAYPAAGPVIRYDDFQIVNGHLIPEPATIGLLVLGGLGALLRRKR